jgi:hypothetical protein
MKVHAILLSALAAAMTAPADVGETKPSTIAAVEVTRDVPAGTFGGVAWRSLEGVIHGEVSSAEPVAGLSALAAGRPSVPYAIAFRIVAPETASNADAVVVEAPNRGNQIIARSLGAPGAAPPSPELAAIGDGFLPGHRIALAAVQWQAGLPGGPPESAQGIGEVAMRDFGRWLGGAFRNGPQRAPVFTHRILAGVSQSAWFVNTFVAEGFNADPESGQAVYQGAFTRNGNGVVLAINGFAPEGRQFPYARNDLAPLAPGQLLARPASDPRQVDVASLNYFYRLRASLFAGAPAPARLRRYATAAPHARGGAAPPETVFGAMHCHGGEPIALSTMSDALYLRPLLLGLFSLIGAETGATRVLPPEALLALVPAPDNLEVLNRLGETKLSIPQFGAEGGQLGGIPMLEATLPLGVAEPPVLPPAVIASIGETCGNFSGWRPFSADELARRYGARAPYLELARQKAADLVSAGYLLDEDEASAVEALASQLPADFR